MDRQRSLRASARIELPRQFEDMGLRLVEEEPDAEGVQQNDIAYGLLDGDRLLRLAADVKSRIYSRDIPRLEAAASEARRHGNIFLLVAPKISASLGKRLRSVGINYADLNGRISIRHPQLTVERSGDRRRPRDVLPNDLDPFKDKASLVLRTLLAEPGRAFGVTEISEIADLTKGWVSRVSSELVARAYADRVDGRLILSQPVDALLDWTHAYDWRMNGIQSFEAAYDKEEIRTMLPEIVERTRSRVALTLLVGSDLIAPHVAHNQIHLYVGQESSSGFLADAAARLYLRPVKQGGSFHVLDPYYAHSVFFDSDVSGGIPVVAPPQLFLDLAGYPVRGSEAAAVLIRSRLASDLNLTESQRDWLIHSTEVLGR